MSDTQLPTTFRDKLREKILLQYAELVPQDQLDALIAEEVNAFFHHEALLTVSQTTVELKNPRYDPARYQGYGNEKTFQQAAFVFGSQMTPFRQLAWSLLHEHLSTKLNAALNDSRSEVRKTTDSWINLTGTPEIVGNTRLHMETIANAMSAAMLSSTLSRASSLAHENMRMSLSAAGMDISLIPEVPAVRIVSG